MTESTLVCSVHGCDKPVKRKYLCYAHYMKNWRYGTPEPEHEPKYVDIVGRRFGLLTVMRRVDEKWELRCDCGALTTARAGDLNRGGKLTCGDKRIHARRDDIEYGAAHGRVAADRGKATSYLCVDCGTQAYHWSYSHSDPEEVISQDARTWGIAYSVNPWFYDPRCVPCHKRFDLGVAG